MLITLSFIFTVSALITISTATSKIDPKNHERLPEENMTAIELIEYYNYPAETHYARTKDGYILTMQRIPHGRNGTVGAATTAPDGKPKQAVLLQHGLSTTSTNWLTNLPNQSLGYVLADNGYDVWLGNVRGNIYSKSHVNLTVKDAKFWDFSWQEIAEYDLPAMVDFILNKTYTKQIIYVGHSQGTLVGFAKFSSDLEFGKKIKLFVALAPVSTVYYITTPVRYLAPFSWPIEKTLELFGDYSFGSITWILNYVKPACELVPEGLMMCENIIFFLVGPESKRMLNQTRIPVYLAHNPDDTSMRNFVHFAQMVSSGKMQKYDYGFFKNLMVYGQLYMDNYFIYAILYALFCVCIIFPPNEFVSSGLTLTSLFSSYLGPEIPTFVEHHIRRSCLNIFAHSCLPLGFLFILSLNDERGIVLFYEHFMSDYYWQIFISISFALPILSICLINFYFKPNDWAKHPIVHNLMTFDQENWHRVATAIEEEYGRIDKFVVNLGAMGRVIVTDSWIILVDPYFVHFAQQADCKLTVVSSDEHNLSIESRSGVQYVKIKVEHISKDLSPFTIRMTSREYREMQTKVQAPLEVARGVVIQLTLHERFVESFREHAMLNHPYLMTDADKENLDNCIGCMQVRADVKLQKRCENSTADIFDEDGQIIPHCRTCYCRPMWCVSCMGRWFASRQRPETVNTWLAGKSPCPTCRATFCMLDVSLVT